MIARIQNQGQAVEYNSQHESNGMDEWGPILEGLLYRGDISLEEMLLVTEVVDSYQLTPSNDDKKILHRVLTSEYQVVKDDGAIKTLTGYEVEPLTHEEVESLFRVTESEAQEESEDAQELKWLSEVPQKFYWLMPEYEEFCRHRH